MREAAADPLASEISAVASKIETARAKVNLCLHVTGRRPDGYHLIDSLVVFAEAADTIRALPGDVGLVKLVIEGQFAAALPNAHGRRDNLVLRAADALLDKFPGGKGRGVTLELNKRLPVASGLGGGSADAAATLRLLNRLWGLKLGAEALAGIGEKLGADVPLCLASRPIRARGAGEKLKEVSVPALSLLLLNPGVEVQTQAVYRRLQTRDQGPIGPIPKSFGKLMEFIHWLRTTRNDLEAPALAEAPVIGKAKHALQADPECLLARMSGSGSTIFGIFMSAAAAHRAADRIHAKRPDWWLAVTTTGGS
jgi:4-diphosphocytidyl-2-C-methyl-D-erythritol kinase